MKIIRAKHLGMCFGVRDAIAIAHAAAREEPVTVLGQLVHNATVVERMTEAGVRFSDHPEDVDTGRGLITAHGASERFRRRAEALGLKITDTTCPLVTSAHRALHGLVAEGYHPVVVGRRDHVEVRGLTEDLREFDVVIDAADIERLPSRSRFGVCSQTTQPIARVMELVERMRCRFRDSEVRFIDTVCQPTKQRQQSAVEVAARADVVIVVGGRNSNNTAELTETCRQFCECVHQVTGPGELNADWFENVRTAGLTAGTSTPDDVIAAVERRMSEMATNRLFATRD